MRKLVLLLVFASLLSGVAAGCGGDDDEPEARATTGAAEAAAGADCSRENLELVRDGKLTIATDNPAYPPWFGGDPGPEVEDWRPDVG